MRRKPSIRPERIFHIRNLKLRGEIDDWLTSNDIEATWIDAVRVKGLRNLRKITEWSPTSVLLWIDTEEEAIHFKLRFADDF